MNDSTGSCHQDPTILSGDLSPELYEHILNAAQIGCDIETSGLDPRVDRIGTFQLYTPHVGTVIVKVKDGIPTLLSRVLECSSLQKIFHHAPFDLSFTSRHWGTAPSNIFCTKIASKILTPEAPSTHHSLQYLLRSYLGISLQKGPVRTSNWDSSELTREQVEYAAADVVSLIELSKLMKEDLAEEGRGVENETALRYLSLKAGRESRGFPDLFAY